MIRRIVYGLFAGLLALVPQMADAQLKVVTSTTDLYDIAREVGGNKITASHIGEGYQDPHFIEAKPSFVLQLRNADVWAFVGLDLEIGWMPLLLDGARNPRIRQGGPAGQSALLARSRERAAHRAAVQGEVHAAGSGERRDLRREREVVRGAPQRGREGLAVGPRHDQGQARRCLAHELALLR
jgi:ABC-type Zn2+ transport system substrate-binding protein/surface adhesin